MFALKKSLKGKNDMIEKPNGKKNKNKRNINIFYILYNFMAEIFSNHVFFDRYCMYHTNTRKVDVYYSNTSWYDERRTLPSKQLRVGIFDFWYEKKKLPSYFNSC